MSDPMGRWDLEHERDQARAEADRLRVLAVRLRDELKDHHSTGAACPYPTLLADPEVQALSGHHPTEVEARG